VCLICHIDYPMPGESEADWLVRVGVAYREAPPLYRQTDQNGQTQKEIVLAALQEGGWVKIRTLCEAIGARMDRVYHMIRDLRKEGYRIGCWRIRECRSTREAAGPLQRGS
jgi:hypothetical protein